MILNFDHETIFLLPKEQVAQCFLILIKHYSLARITINFLNHVQTKEAQDLGYTLVPSLLLLRSSNYHNYVEEDDWKHFLLRLMLSCFINHSLDYFEQKLFN